MSGVDVQGGPAPSSPGRFESVSKEELGNALLSLYRVLAPAEGDFNEEEQQAMDEARVVLGRCGVDLDAEGEAR